LSIRFEIHEFLRELYNIGLSFPVYNTAKARPELPRENHKINVLPKLRNLRGHFLNW
jgi:hypothetical protein